MNANTLIQRAVAQLRAWHTKYGKHAPGWLPPAGDVDWLEDASAYLAAHTLPGSTVTKTYPDGTTATGPGPLPEQSPAADLMVDVAPGYCNPVTGEPYLQNTDPLQRVLAGLDYFLIVKEERRFIEGARAELALHLAPGVDVPLKGGA